MSFHIPQVINDPLFSTIQSQAYIQNPFYPLTPLFLYFIQPTHQFHSVETMEFQTLSPSLQQQTCQNEPKTPPKPKKTHKIAKCPKVQKRIQSKSSRLYAQSGLSGKAKTAVAQTQTKKNGTQNGAQISLNFRIGWKNQYRNVVPNLVNQILSFLTKKCKSQSYLQKLFAKIPHPSNWHLAKFYHYAKIMKDGISHYVDEKVLSCFFRTQEASGHIYEEGEQEFYMKIMRIAVLHYLRNEAVTVSLSSSRIDRENRVIHLIARQAILQKFTEIAHNKFQ